MALLDKIKEELEQPFIDFMDWYRTHPEYENVVSSKLVKLFFENLQSDEKDKNKKSK